MKHAVAMIATQKPLVAVMPGSVLGAADLQSSDGTGNVFGTRHGRMIKHRLHITSSAKVVLLCRCQCGGGACHGAASGACHPLP